ncbi:RICIN domain-containing protein [Bacillus cereus]|uniref:RICIN domain-containing protein n=1 Tax=Bacillus cereus TaxID=1396 RepID=UPI00027A952B|nr:RICIN domain-containing protein [Bacillus cereus]EJS62822.1 hypothetical protein ICU_04896 [Bacillus cereus BAG2X1-1]EJS64665.1 hypothetical protein ICY_05148 [Bacillus cereus BAG2X1-3]PEA06787.1 toxin [Bacillus cereus]
MKSLSKKVVAGLLVGATSLSIWAPASEAATLKNNKYYTINSKVDTKLAWAPYSSSFDSVMEVLPVNNQDEQKYLFFQLDGGSYAIVNKSSGKVSSYDPNIAITTLSSTSWKGSPSQQWHLRDQGNGYYEIMNQGNGKVATTRLKSSWGSPNLNIDLDNSNPSDPEKLFLIEDIDVNAVFGSITGIPLPGGVHLVDPNAFSVQNLPNIGTRPNAPDYDYNGGVDQQLPQTSNSVVVGASLIPCIMVQDNSADDYTKIHNSPYYTLVKEEYWDKTFSAVVPAGLTRNYSFKTGMTSVDQQKMTDTLSMKIGADFGLKFGDLTAGLKTEISRTIQTEISTTNTELSEEQITSNIVSEAGKTTGFTEYQLATKYTLKRADGSIVSDPWVVKNNKITIARKNAK